MKSVSEITIHDVLASDVLTVVKFHADWCAPCRAMKPAWDAVADRFDDRAHFVTANIDDVASTAAQFGVQKVPTFIAFKSGAVVSMKPGSCPQSELAAWVEQTLSGEKPL
jgi:thioredoxin 1